MTGTTVTVSVATTPSNTNSSDRRETDDIFFRSFKCGAEENSLNTKISRCVRCIMWFLMEWLMFYSMLLMHSCLSLINVHLILVSQLRIKQYIGSAHITNVYEVWNKKSRKEAESAPALSESCSGPQCQPASCPQWNTNRDRTGGLKYCRETVENTWHDNCAI